MNLHEYKHHPVTAVLKATILLATASLAFLLNPGFLVGCGPGVRGYGGCPQYEPSKKAARQALEEAPTRYEFAHEGGTIGVEFEWLEIEAVAQRQALSLVTPCHAYEPCSAFETIRVTPSMTMTWTPQGGEVEVIAQDLVFHESSFFDSAHALSEEEDEIRNFVRTSDPEGRWLIVIERTHPEDYELMVIGWVGRGPSVLDPPGTPEAPCWLEIRGGDVERFEPQNAPD